MAGGSRVFASQNHKNKNPLPHVVKRPQGKTLGALDGSDKKEPFQSFAGYELDMMQMLLLMLLQGQPRLIQDRHGQIMMHASRLRPKSLHALIELQHMTFRWLKNHQGISRVCSMQSITVFVDISCR